jgi:hypothetical protein
VAYVHLRRGVAPPPNRSLVPCALLVASRLAKASICSTLPCTRARLPSKASKAPDALRVSSARLLIALGLQRLAKSERSRKRPAEVRSTTRLSTACAPMFLRAASE